MKVTNRLGLPSAFVNAVSVRRHNEPGCYSATTLNKGVKEIVLTDRHFDELEADAADSVWAVWGTAVHALMESQKDENFHEEKFAVKVSDSTVTGQVDSYDMENQVIYDWKTASVWKVIKADFADWKAQGMTYAWLMSQKGLAVKKCRFVALLKDHSKTKAATDSSYPQSPVFVYEFDVTEEGLAETAKRIEKKVMELEAASLLADDDVPPCSESERWAEPPVWAVMKEGRKSAVKLCDSDAAANGLASELGDKHYVQFRPGASRKCEGYCPCREFCDFWKKQSKQSKEEAA